jgi:1-acyl-sn-glycerol-3-phosphate acyltransferase
MTAMTSRPGDPTDQPPWYRSGAMLDELTQAVLAREDVARYLKSGRGGQPDPDARERIFAYLDELRTTQRYRFYRALKHPLYPILRKIHREAYGLESVRAAVGTSRVIYASNHRSHMDYLIEPLVLDDNGIRPPIIAAGINLFGGPLGLLHRHVTGAIPIRRNTKDPAYLLTLKAYIAEVLQRHDLLFYPEGGRSYSGDLRPPKTGLFHAALQAGCPDLVVVPTGIAYDLVLEDHVLARQGVKRRQRPFTREFAEMVRYAVGYESRAIVRFGAPIPLSNYDPAARRDVMTLAHEVQHAIGRLVTVVPTPVVAAAMSPSITRSALEERVARLLETLTANGAALDITSPAEIVDQGSARLIERNVIVCEADHYRVRERSVLRYYARSIAHLLRSPADARAH